ncbi:MAG: hypothetical protein LBR29_04085 [Methylobacteriaceae bacterium]|jgi:hypothetical protein|nr:hypothetical protein [Methylobacteriaceae bacterium]
MRFAGILITICLISLSGPGCAANPLPDCSSPSVLADISAKFRTKERAFWNSSLSIDRIERVRQVAWDPWGRNTILRRFCSGTAVMSDGRKRRVQYSIREGLGFAGLGWGVQWCVTGVDRNRAYGAACRAARP